MTNRINKNPKLDPIDSRITAALINQPLTGKNKYYRDNFNTRYDVNASPDSPTRNKIDAYMSKTSGIELS
jgi:hypothetical protein